MKARREEETRSVGPALERIESATSGARLAVEPTLSHRQGEVLVFLGAWQKQQRCAQWFKSLCAGRLRYLARSDDGIDALVAAAAVGDGSPAVLLTSEPDDLERLLQQNPQVGVRAV